ncbi:MULTISPECIES: enoyl-CoA hydratase/isomerase family protein [unclassified Rhodanobacter]|uniref:enoyl-CoA hydratase/isomerase family protein n=1 Tax=unclassified Rhodanobacter TaxID=2621553 RepID=UPI001BDF9AE7|nr:MULTISPECIES: enoyl-CoA hydratase/isomerase family protein [unclassified Rhodanobacter]MBT2144724.1 enoyl-CoA hydratase/isomerase family protein [Rhodanobacter sp. LX-99]MBT2148769.1 enoyl-CoA hydratase/isomerase family protein [Rhodanobacter sp. LX-100]
MLNITNHDNGIREIQLARPPVNALNLELLRALHAAVDDAVQGGVRGIVLSGAQGLFSAGVDVPALLGRDRAGVREYWREFFALCAALARAPIPLVAAITGHSPAGGAVLALFCDYRVMAEGPYRIGLNEVQVGLIVPESIQLALRRVVGTYRAERLLVAGAMIEAGEALACGFVDELTGVDQVSTRALHWLGELLALPSHAMLATRTLARADLAAAYADLDALPLDGFVEEFFHPQTQAVLQQLVARLKNKSEK